MKRVFISLLVVLISATAFSQESENKYGKIGENLKFGFEFISDVWPDTPENLDTNYFNRGFNMNLMWDHKLGKSPFSLGFGLGLSSHNQYSKTSILKKNADGIQEFVRISDTISMSSSKLNLTYLDIPLELRYKFDFGLHINAGFKVGYLISSTSKYEGDGVAYGFDDDIIKVKFKDLDNLNEWRYGPTLRVGYKWINLSAYYQLSDVFIEGGGPKMAPITIGIGVMPF